MLLTNAIENIINRLDNIEKLMMEIKKNNNKDKMGLTESEILAFQSVDWNKEPETF